MLLLSSQSFPHYGLERFFHFAKEAGFAGVEIVMNENYDTQDPEYLKALSARYDIEIKAFSLTSRNPEKYMEVFQKVVREFPKSTMNLESPQVFSFAYKTWMKSIVPKLAQKYQLRLNRINSVGKTILGILPGRSENSLYALKQAGKVALDISALWTNKEEPMRAISLLGESLGHVYLSNVYRNQPYSPLPDGIIPVESFLTKLKQLDYSKDFTLKISPKLIHEGDDEMMVQTLIDSRKFFERYFLGKKESSTKYEAPVEKAPEQVETNSPEA